jgi:ribosomal protein S18 acetylase RimI-like enzyme
MSIRRLVPTDASTYRALMLDAYERHPDAFTSSVTERAALPLSWWESRLDDRPQPPNLVLGAFHGGQLAGVAGLSFEPREKARHKATLFGTYVHPGYRHAGLGGSLVVAALECARARDGVRLVQLTVTQGNEIAQGLYERCGFVPFGIEPLAVAVGPTFVSKVHMWCDLGGGGAALRA